MEEDRWIDVTVMASAYEEQISFVTNKWRHRKRGEDEWRDGRAPDAGKCLKQTGGEA